MRSVPILLSALLLASCFGGFERRPPEKQRFMLQPTQSAQVSSARIEVAPEKAGVLRVARVRVSPVFDHKGFVYQTGPNSFETDFYNEFFSPPGILMREAVLGWLEASQLFVPVSRDSAAEASWVLETDVDQLFADQRGGGLEAHLEIVFRLLDARTRKIVFEKRYSAREQAADDSAAALIDTWNRELGSMLAELVQDVRPITTASTGAP
jgi:cholesterol transport system auxiliary component